MSNYLSVPINILKILKIISARFQDGAYVTWLHTSV